MNPRGAERLMRAACAARTLSETLWDALHEELADPSAARVAELSEGLSEISATVALLARGGAGSTAASVEPESSPVRPAREEAPAQRDAPARPDASALRDAPAGRDAVTWRDAPAGSTRDAPAGREAPAGGGFSAPTRESSSMAVIVDELAPRESPEIAIRDERGEPAPSAWIASIARLLERYARDRTPFAVLLVELADVDRLRHAELPGEGSRLTGLVVAALSAELRPADSLTRESPGRYWLLAPETDSGAAAALAERLAAAVRGAASHRGTSLQVAGGIAVCPVDG